MCNFILFSELKIPLIGFLLLYIHFDSGSGPWCQEADQCQFALKSVGTLLTKLHSVKIHSSLGGLSFSTSLVEETLYIPFQREILEKELMKMINEGVIDAKGPIAGSPMTSIR